MDFLLSYASTSPFVCACVRTGARMYTWRPEVAFGCHSQSLSRFSVGQGLPLNPELSNRLDWPESSVPTSPAQGWAYRYVRPRLAFL